MAKKKRSNRSAQTMMVIIALVILLLTYNVAYLGVTGKHMVNKEDIKEY